VTDKYEWSGLIMVEEFKPSDAVRNQQRRKLMLERGRIAYMGGVTLQDCPYRHPPDISDWKEGWLAANRADPLIDDDEREPEARRG
jgi:hypothetical protein